MSAHKLKGVLVAFEGIDGSGKTTQAALLESWAKGQQLEVISTKEPTTGPFGMRIRNSKFTQRLTPQEELECFVEDRKEHVAQLLLPALTRGALVIVDRYYYSSAAYQGARGLDPQVVLATNRAFAPVPDRVFLFDLDVAAGLQRVQTRGLGQDLFETHEELTRARAIFNSLRDSHIVPIDATKPIAEVHAKVVTELVNGPLRPLLKT